MPARAVVSNQEYKPTAREVETNILINLRELGAKIHKRAKTGSIYIKFEDRTLGNLRIGDHDGREKYRYRWNIRADVDESYKETIGNRTRYYYSFYDVHKCVEAIKEYARGAYLYEY